ncbi:MAG: 3-isopropylmalate dehydratase [Peptococcaceae bacterium BICA1-8]|nr:MAG: 3-isopropylmalate dehydratase [Peptococcaceae bacterium BICA1-8]
MHAIHKILAEKSGKQEVKAGEIVNAKVDIAGINDIYLTVLISYDDMGGGKVWDPEKIVFFFDHNAPSPTIKGASNQKVMSEFAREQGIKKIFKINEGICHSVLSESGLVKPGDIIIITDSHTTTLGAFGAFATGVGSTDLAVIMMTGELWFRVPEVINVKLEGTLKDGVMAKDIALHMLGELGTEFATYKVIEYSDSVVEKLSIDERMVLCNMSVEMGAKSTYIRPNSKTIEYVKSRSHAPFIVHETDPDFIYDKEYIFNLDNLLPQVSIPDSVDNARNIEEVEGISIDQVFIGSCTGGKLTDLEAAANILKGKKIAESVRLVVTPSSKEVLTKAIERGYYQTFLDAGAAITTPGCGACFGGHSGLIAAGEKCATTSNRNFPGRMGSIEAGVYLVSPITAAYTAITGKLNNPQYK